MSNCKLLLLLLWLNISDNVVLLLLGTLLLNQPRYCDNQNIQGYDSYYFHISLPKCLILCHSLNLNEDLILYTKGLPKK
jgi:hypothetical protein